jgi:hypothetical protein
MAQRRPDRTLGPPHDEFWAWCDKSQLRLPRCTQCQRLSWPPRARCEYCAGAAFEWERVTGRGRLVSWCTFERDYYRSLLPLPWETILVELDEGPLMISNPHGLALSEAVVGQSVQVAFIDCEDSAGHFKLPVFAPA